MPSRTSNFKKETATDSKQDAEISTLTHTLNNEITCNTINPTIINLGADKLKIEAQGSQLTVYGNAYYSDYIVSAVEITAPLGTYNKACLGTENVDYPATLVVDGTSNTITSNRNASLSGINNISCKSIAVNSHTSASGAVNIDAEGTQLTVYANNGIYCTGNIITPSLMSAENIYCTNSLTCNQLNYNTLNPPIASKSLLTYYVDGSCGSD